MLVLHYRLSLLHDSSEILSQSGDVLQANDDISITNRDSNLILTSLTTEVVFVKINTFMQRLEGTYRLIVTPIVEEVDIGGNLSGGCSFI